jgi:hypothetical protein
MSLYLPQFEDAKERIQTRLARARLLESMMTFLLDHDAHHVGFGKWWQLLSRWIEQEEVNDLFEPAALCPESMSVVTGFGVNGSSVQIQFHSRCVDCGGVAEGMPAVIQLDCKEEENKSIEEKVHAQLKEVRLHFQTGAEFMARMDDGKIRNMLDEYQQVLTKLSAFNSRYAPEWLSDMFPQVVQNPQDQMKH